MTLVEIVVSMAMMFFILTAVLGLVLQSTRMSAQAKQQNVLTNAVSAYTEWLHTLPFEDVNLIADGGVLEPEHVVDDTGVYTVTVRPTVTPGEDPTALKNVRIEVEIARPDGWSQSLVTQTTVRDRTKFLNQATVDPGARPTVSFLSQTPPEGAVVWDDDWSGGKLAILVEAEAAGGRQIATVKYYLEYGNTPLEDISGNLAHWSVDSSAFSSVHSPFFWWTLQTQTDSLGNIIEVVGDGPHTIIVEVIDDAGARETIHRSFIVDNSAPPVPGPLSFDRPSAAQTKIVWNPVQDGAGPAKGYETDIWHQQSSGSWVDAVDPNPTVSESEYTLDHADFVFARYQVRVRSYSSRPLYSDWQEFTAFETRPAMTGTYTVKPITRKDNAVVANLSVSEPTFPTTGSIIYTFRRVVDGVPQEPPLYSGPLSTLTHEVRFSANNAAQWSSNYPITRYVCDVTYTPDGYQGGVEQTLRSNTISTEFQSTHGEYAFSEGSW